MTGRLERGLRWALGLGSLAALGVAWAQSDPLCPWLGGCEYEAPAFSIRIVDQDTGQPVPDAHALALWTQYGPYGRKGPVMALEAISNADGSLSFASWGPVRGSGTGLVPGVDPAISVFRPGYRALLIENRTPHGQKLNARIHAFQQPGQTFTLARLEGTPAEVLAELRKAADPLGGGGLSQHDPAPIRRVFVSRWKRVRTEAEGLPRDSPEVQQLFWRLDTGIQLMEGEAR
jgi:hypothetical protein